MKPWLDGALRRSPFQPAFRWRASRRLAVLAYHAIDDPERFEAQLDVLSREAHPVTLDDVAAAASGGALPRRAVLVTIDDADATLRDHALPLLRERGIPAVAFVVAALLDGERPIWTRDVAVLASTELVRSLKRVPDDERRTAVEELRRRAPTPAPASPQLRRADLPALRSAGIAIGNHTATHPILPRCDDGTVRREIEGAHAMLAAALGEAPDSFAYPNGDHDPRGEEVLRELGYRTAFAFDHRLARVPPEPLRISRLWANASDPVDRFRIVLSGLQPALYRARVRVGAARSVGRGAPAAA